MRLKLALAILSTAGAAVAVVMFLTRPQPQPAATDHPAPVAAAPSNEPEAVAVTPVNPPASTAPAPAKTETAEEHRTRVEAEVEQLLEWSMVHEPASLSNILASLTSPEKEIRAAAVEAARQFDSTNAISALKAAANATDDLREKIECLEAAEFLTLPALPFSHPPAELQEQMEAQALARQKELNESREQPPNAPPAMPVPNQ
jgi:hypothetical protein